MERREALRRAATLAAAVAVAGCSARRATGPRTPPPPGERDEAGGGGGGGDGTTDLVSVADLDIQEADDGHLQVVATVVNRGDTERTRTLRLSVTVDGETVERSSEVTVGPGEEREVAVDFPTVAYDEFAAGGSLSSELR